MPKESAIPYTGTQSKKYSFYLKKVATTACFMREESLEPPEDSSRMKQVYNYLYIVLNLPNNIVEFQSYRLGQDRKSIKICSGLAATKSQSQKLKKML